MSEIWESLFKTSTLFQPLLLGHNHWAKDTPLGHFEESKKKFIKSISLIPFPLTVGICEVII